jgi:cytoskeletal protein CcmA (bactofilin family)
MNKPITPNAPPAFRPDIARVDAPRPEQARTDMSRFDMPRRPDMPMGAQGSSQGGSLQGGAPAPADAKLRKLTVGPDIALTGEISACDYLVVEGTVEARVREGRHIEIAESGLFRGTVEIDEADIGGRFEGEITVRGRLRVRSSGRIEGKVQYGELEVEAGGQLEGEIRGLKKKAVPVADKTVPQSGAKTRSIGVSETVAETHQSTIQQPVADKV